MRRKLMSDKINNADAITNTMEKTMTGKSERKIERKFHRKALRKPTHPTIDAMMWAFRVRTAIEEILFAISKGADVAAKKGSDDGLKQMHMSYMSDRASRAIGDKIFFANLETVVRAAEDLAAKTAGYRTWAKFRAVQRANR
jgi:hypothetical protein